MNNNELSDFIKIAYKYNKVKDVNEAFEKYPVEKEWHEGKIDNVIRKKMRNIINTILEI